jgi:eukaryotic-like serine/threonine-protein kinase
MPATPGSRLGGYEIIAALGAGGMGEVYRARDVKLGREVALKILPASFTTDPDRVARFRREAQVLASLNHPHVGAIYGLDDADGTQFLVLELVEGESLDKRIARGPIPVDEALAIARQTAEALEAAHEKGIVHRDLKPANIALTRDGSVKVLDFGLAKATEPTGASLDVTNSPTITTPAMMSGVGMILGTAAYMSPEQAKGRPADKRSDVWAFGCVLFEMLSGRRAFDGEDVADTLAAVLRGEPDFAALPPDTPSLIVALLRRCLERDHRRRVGDIAAARFAVDEARSTSSASSRTSEVAEKPLRSAFPAFAAALVATGALAAAAAWLLKPERTSSPPVVRFTHSLKAGDAFSGTMRRIVTISPDGTRIVYSANSRLYQRRIDELESEPIPGTDLGGQPLEPIFSPDGRWIAFYSPVDGTLQRIPSNGGSPTTLVQTTSPTGMTWSESGIVFARGSEGIFLLGAQGGQPKALLAMKDGEFAFNPQLLPGGDAVLFTVANNAEGGDRWDRARIVVHTLSSGARKVVVDGASDGRYVSSGHLLFAVSGTLFAHGFNPAAGSTTSERIPVIVGVRRSLSYNSGAAQFAVSETGSLAYLPGPVNATLAQRALIVSDQSGRSIALKLPRQNYVSPRVSPDGKRLAVEIADGRDASIWVYDLAETTALRRLTLKGRNQYPVWSADGQFVAFQSDVGGDAGIFWQRADGVGVAERLTTAPRGAAHAPESFSPSGKHLLFSEQKDGTYALQILSLKGKTSAPFGNVQSTQPPSAGFSPDGHWVVYASTKQAGGERSADRGIFVQPFPTTGAIFQAPKVRIDFHPVWTPKGDAIVYAASTAVPLVRVAINTQPSLTFGPPVELPPPIPQQLSTEPRGFDLLPDGRILATSSEQDAGSTLGPEIRVVINWSEELTHRVPVNRR